MQDVLPRKGAKLLYQYDFGDGWEHLIKVVAIRPSEPGEKAPRCLDGERACPPEDCGGPYGYPELLAAIADPKHPNHADLAEWIGDDIDCEAFDLSEVNGILSGSSLFCVGRTVSWVRCGAFRLGGCRRGCGGSGGR